MRGGYYMEQNTQQDRAKLLEQQAREYLMRSDDPIFTQYVQQLIPRIQKQPQYVEQLQAELDKSVEYWHQRQKLNAERAESAAAGQVQETAQPPVQETMQEHSAGQFTEQQTGQFTGQPAAEPVVQGTKKKQNAEYLIGTIALSVMGGVFILTALVLMGMYFMNGWIKGISVCGIPGRSAVSRAADPEKITEACTDIFGDRYGGFVSVHHDQYAILT